MEKQRAISPNVEHANYRKANGMKITKRQLIELINEELASMHEDEGGKQASPAVKKFARAVASIEKASQQ